MKDATVFVVPKPIPTKEDPQANHCWCHKGKDLLKVGDPFIAISSQGNNELLLLCPRFAADLVATFLGMHIAAAKGKLKDWPLLEVPLIHKEEN